MKLSWFTDNEVKVWNRHFLAGETICQLPSKCS
ncbi:hypothetical protein [Pseudomonas phage vB_PaeP_4029]|nr:hypothetical protein [Pseudomonas phage vB_PaeP_4029]UYE96519.1 hypothetical protein [Pseudomonas phage vB_PaeP_4032]UYE96605.1 hypothetical protein [Pseudomonas phage vB_PaeP_4034]